jgi:hypothetical protein
MTRDDWIVNVKVGDTVAVWIAGERKADEIVTSATDTLIAIGRYRGRKNFRRRDGRICGKMPLRHLIYIGRPE